jgi:hypothetical protein
MSYPLPPQLRLGAAVRAAAQAPPPQAGRRHPPGEEGRVDFFQGPPTFDQAQGRWRRPWIFRLMLSCSKHGYEEPLWTQDRDGFLRATSMSFVRLGGVLKVIRHDYVPRNIIELLCPTGLCGRASSKAPRQRACSSAARARATTRWAARRCSTQRTRGGRASPACRTVSAVHAATRGCQWPIQSRVSGKSGERRAGRTSPH